ncbi:MAG: hypothetical protein ACI9D5_001817 [Candidatus Endobugula sp.]|jgi:hypothetical protein
MFEEADMIDGFISIAGGIYAYLVATGEIKINYIEGKPEAWKNRYGKLLKICSVFLVLFGVFTVSKLSMGL